MGFGRFLFDTENKFGRLMMKVGIIIVTNLMFLFFSIPVFTIGASYTAMYHVVLKELRSKNDINPFIEFWRAFRSNFRQATICWTSFLLFEFICCLGVKISRIAGGIYIYIEAMIGVMGIVGFWISLYLFPTIAAFANTIPNLFKNAVFFMGSNIWISILILGAHSILIIITILDKVYQPFYVFCWFFFGFGLIAFGTSYLLLKIFVKYLD